MDNCEGQQAVLAALRTIAESKWMSGAELAERLGVSRSAVWKHVAALRRQGYVIEARPKRGYRLLSGPDQPTAAEVAPLLTTRSIGRNYRFAAQVDSTNVALREWMNAADKVGERLPEGAVIVADHQTSGRGRRGRSWYSASGSGIWMSVLLRPELVPAQAGILTLMAAVAVRQAVLAVTGVQLRIKWPNDLLAADRKVCGILIELAADHERIASAIVGIGINVRQPTERFPPDVTAVAGTLEQACGRTVSRPRLVAALCGTLEHYYELIRSGDIQPVLAGWRAGADWLGDSVTVHLPAGRLVGEAVDIAADGSLLIKTGDGNTRSVYAGDVSLRL